MITTLMASELNKDCDDEYSIIMMVLIMVCMPMAIIMKLVMLMMVVP